MSLQVHEQSSKPTATHLVTSLRWARIALMAGAVLGFWLPTRGFALDPAKDIHQYACRSWSRQNGLPVNGINAIAQTKDGYLWLGTRKGLVRFDGVDFTLIGMAQAKDLRSTIVGCLEPSQTGGLWVGLEEGGYGHYETRRGWSPGSDDKGAAEGDTHALVEMGNGELLVGSTGVSILRAKDGTTELVFGELPEEARYDVTAAHQGSGGRVWLGTASKGLFCWENGKLTKVGDPSLDSDLIFAIAEDQSGQLWLGTHIGLRCYDSQLRRKEVDFPITEIRALLVDRQNVLWIGTAGSGVMRWQGTTLVSFRKSNGLTDDFVQALAEDREGSLWIGTRTGLSQLTDVKFPAFSELEETESASVQSVSASPRGGIWVATSKGAIYVDGQSRIHPAQTGSQNLYVKRVFEASNGDVFLVSGRNEIEILSAGKLVARHETSGMPVAMAEDSNGVVVSVAGELYRVGRTSLAPYRFANGQKPPLHWILNLTVARDGALWVASVNGVCRVENGEFQQWTEVNGLVGNRVRWVCEDDEGVIWVSTATGLARLKGNQVRNIREEDGLFDANIYASVPDDRGYLWMDSTRGLYRVSRKSLNDFIDGKTRRVECIGYDSPEAVKAPDKTNQEQSACRTQDNHIWFPSPAGVLKIDPGNILTNHVPPPVYVHEVRANGTNVALTNNLVVRPGKGDLELHYTALSFITPQKLRFRYQLEGYDSDWVEAENRRVAFYTNLKPGHYKFRVIACNADGIWNTAGDSLDVRLLPHFHQTVWFRLFYGILVSSLLAGLYFWRLRLLRRKQRALHQAQEILEARVLERTSDLAAANASLKTEIEERKRMEMEIERVHQQLMYASRQAGMAEVATGVLHNVGNVLNSVNTSASMIMASLKTSKVDGVSRVVELLEGNRENLAQFLATDGRADQVIIFLKSLAQRLGSERKVALNELQELTTNIEHIKEIVAMQQRYAKVSGVTEKVKPVDLVEDALRMNEGALARHEVQLVREYGNNLPEITVEKHKVLQILVNLIRNAKYACDDSPLPDKQLTVRVTNGDDRVRIAVMDNGIGIPPENLTRIFSHGFTTRKNGHGFGLHSGALAAKELGGGLLAHSDGPGCGATFTLDLPAQPK